MIPPALTGAVMCALRETGDASPVVTVERVMGGYATAAARLITRRHSYMLKWSEQPRPGLFPAEARGLHLLHQVGGVRVPAVLAAADADGDVPGFLLEEWIAARPSEAYWQLGARFGETIAAFHRRTAAVPVPGYGLDYDNYVGKSMQANGWESDWVRFFRERRLRPQVELAEHMGRLPPGRRRGLERVMERLEEWLGGVERQPVLLHGDLWMGNVLFDATGEPVLVDPAVCWGDREFDLATVEIYHAAPDGFHEAYSQVWPIGKGFDERRDLHNLYLLLCCLTEDGVLGERIDAVLEHYVDRP